MSVFLFTGLLLLGIGVIFLIVGIVFLISGKKLYHYTASVMGTLTGICDNAVRYNQGIKEISSATTASDAEDFKYMTYTYEVDSVTYERAGMIGYNESYIRKRIGNQVTVWYDPKNPKQSELTKHGVIKIIGYIFTPLGALFTVLGGIFVYIYLR